MRTRTVCIWAVAFAVALSSASYGYQAHFYDEAGSYDYEYEAGTAHLLYADGYGDYAHNSSIVQIWVINNEWGSGTCYKDGRTGVYITDYDPNSDPTIELHYWYIVSAWVHFYSSPPGPGSGSGQAHAILLPGYDQTHAQLSYTGEEYEKDYERIDVEQYVDMSYDGAEFELYGWTYADLDVSADDSASNIEGWDGGGIYDAAFEIIVQ